MAEALKDVAALKAPPHSLEAEQAVLGGLMLDNRAWDVVSDSLSETDFYLPKHRLIFKVIHELSKKNSPFDVVTLSEALKDLGELSKVGGDLYLFELSKNTPSAANVRAYAQIVRDRSILRQLIDVAGDIANQAYFPEGRTTETLLDEAETKVFRIAEQGNVAGEGPQDIQSLMGKAMERIDILYHSDDPITGLSTGYTDLDHLTSGLQKGDLVIVAGRPSMGKTVFAMNVAEAGAIKARKPVLVFSLEMPGDALAMRLISSLGRVEQHKVRSGQLEDHDWPRITSAVSLLSEVKLFIDDKPGITPGEMRARARRLAKEQGELGLIVVDYLQLMRAPGFNENRTAEISEISRSLKMLAKELHVPVLALSQLNRSLEQRADRRPMMSDLRESGAIEQDADVIAFIYRDEVYNPDTPDKGIAEIIVAKQRNGPIGKVRLTFLGKYTRFENYVDNSRIE